MAASIIRSTLDGLLNEVITTEQAAEQIDRARALGPGFVDGSLVDDDGLVLYQRAHNGARIAPVHIWRYEAGGKLPTWHSDFFATATRDCTA